MMKDLTSYRFLLYNQKTDKRHPDSKSQINVYITLLDTQNWHKHYNGILLYQSINFSATIIGLMRSLYDC